ncbi:EAL domain-containing response regulator [Halarcobacter anaerophilus]|uniref:Diguanylate cyclase n=1 Tax=Halarcobacter anaerophilus TaxID=877500 RepID=A0A4Q0XUY3_9BACT|nr:EAL domain-containing protein [Halarcobacter anaerophilus]QDF28224.1 response regulator receiver-modulated diguanylate cyclase/phosphodiesterase [Halarcobacter anaerophilus]RXJ61380.1 diguanylate cyclase [Halarcobacter anaerophilus]
MISNVSILKNITILYAEDEEALKEITLNILKGFTKKQLVAKNGAEGLELFKQNESEIDLIITDVNMPVMNGLEMIREIKKINPNIPIIVATAFSNTEYLLEAIDIGVDKYVLKPIDMKKLLQLMSQSLLYHELKDLYIDNLTHLPNRNRLKKDLEDSNKDLMAMINIDKFSTINDLFGEHNGDRVLLKFSDTLQKYFNKDKFSIYRVEADKFLVISKEYELDIQEFYDLCKKFEDFIEEDPVCIDEHEIDLNITIGIAKSEDGNAYKYAQRVISYARKKFEPILIYNDSFNIQESFEENIKWIKKIKNGVKNDNFKAYFQPIVDTKTKEIYKYEALVRYIDEDGTVVSPFTFLDIAKKAKLYPNIIKIMINEAFHLIKTKNKRVAVNISFEDIASATTMEYVYKVIEENSEYASSLEFEILESEEISDFSEVFKFIKNMNKYGCNVGVDDFGAGYSNFNMLVNLDINYVKIDGSLIRGINESKNQQIIVKTIDEFAKKFGFKTVAEFVSEEEIYNEVKEIGVDYSQGYYFDAPLSYDEI